MKNINQLLSTNGIEVSMWYWVLHWCSASRWHELKTIEYLPASFQHEWKQSVYLWYFLSAVSHYSLFKLVVKCIRKVRPSTILHGNLKMEVSLYETLQMFPVYTTAGEVLTDATTTGHWGRLIQGDHVIIVTPSFSKTYVFRWRITLDGSCVSKCGRNQWKYCEVGRRFLMTCMTTPNVKQRFCF